MCIGLGWLGSKPAEGGYVLAARMLTVWYFLHFIVVLPLLGLVEKPKPLPNSISESVLRSAQAKAIAAVARSLPSPARPFDASAHRAGRGAGARAADARRGNKWSFAGLFGHYDPGAAAARVQDLPEVCSTCHSLKLVAFRNLAEPRADPDFSAAQAAAIAAMYKVNDGPNDQGHMFQRPGRPADIFPPPFPNDAAARFANGGALPPDMSVLAKARSSSAASPGSCSISCRPYQEHGPDYIDAVLKGYARSPPA